MPILNNASSVIIKYAACPICNSGNIQPHIEVKDFSVSKEIFKISFCEQCTGLFTDNVPNQARIVPYYQFENYISHTDTSTGVIDKLYKSVRKLTLRTKRKLIEQYSNKRTGQILDVGCGTGAFLKEMKENGWHITGLEPDELARNNANRINGINPLPSDDLYSLDTTTDAITLWHVLEHVHDLHGYMKRFNNLLNADGILCIAVPNYTSNDATHYRANWAAYDVPRHLYHFSPKSMQILAASHGFKIEAMQPMWFDSFYVSLLSEQYKNGSQNLVSAFWRGLVSNAMALINPSKCSSIIYIPKKIN